MNTPTHETRTLASHATQDWIKALRMWRLWTALGMEDLSDRYRKTLFGISWVVTSFASFVLVKILVFGQMAGMSFSDFALYVTIGFGLWSFINSMVMDSCMAYSASKNWILGDSIPYPVFFLQSIFRNWVVFLLLIAVMLAALVWQKGHWTPIMLAALPGLLIYAITPIWLVAILAPLCARHRDVMHAVQTSMRLLFFATPIVWMPSQGASLALMAKYNVIAHFIEIVRVPLIYDAVPYDSWMVVLVTNGVGLLIGAITYTSTRNRIVYWL